MRNTWGSGALTMAHQHNGIVYSFSKECVLIRKQVHDICRVNNNTASCMTSFVCYQMVPQSQIQSPTSLYLYILPFSVSHSFSGTESPRACSWAFFSIHSTIFFLDDFIHSYGFKYHLHTGNFQIDFLSTPSYLSSNCLLNISLFQASPPSLFLFSPSRSPSSAQARNLSVSHPCNPSPRTAIPNPRLYLWGLPTIARASNMGNYLLLFSLSVKKRFTLKMVGKSKEEEYFMTRGNDMKVKLQCP